MKVWNITCECGHDSDYLKLSVARKIAKEHIGHNKDGAVYIDQVDTDPAPFEDYQTGKSIVVK